MKTPMLLIILFILSSNCFSQVMKYRIFCFESPDQIPNSINSFKLYYGIDSSAFIEMNGRKFLRFIFSEDSSEHVGFVSFDSREKDFLFISKKSVENKELVVQKVFRFKNNNNFLIDNFGFLGSKLRLKRQICATKTIFTPVYMFPKDNHSIYIKSIEFEQEYAPVSITFVVPFGESKTIEVPFRSNCNPE